MKTKMGTLEFVVLGILIIWAGHWFVYSFQHYYERDGIAAAIGSSLRFQWPA
jgi:hypothetical protein